MPLLPEVPSRSDDQSFRRFIRVFQMVHHLHKTGYQGLRVMTAVSGSGLGYRFFVIPSSVLRYSPDSSLSYSNIAHLSLGANTTNPRDEAAYHGSGMENKYFGWEDAPGKTADELANLFIQRCPHIAELSLTRDWKYAGWFNELLGKIENGWIPVCYYVATGHNVEGIELNRHSAFGHGNEIFPWPPDPPFQVRRAPEVS